MSYTPTARAGSLRRQHHGGDGFGQVTISSETVPQFSADAAIASLSTPSSAPQPTTTAYTGGSSSGAKTTSWAPTVTSSKDASTAFAQSTMPGWAASAQVPTYQQSNAPMYLAIGGGIVLLGIIIIASRRPAKATANKRKRARRRRS